jgi:SulP family sulfate permease
VCIDVTHAHCWDLTSVSALDQVVLKLRRQGAEVEVLGLNHASATIVDRLGVHGKSEVLEELLSH